MSSTSESIPEVEEAKSVTAVNKMQLRYSGLANRSPAIPPPIESLNDDGTVMEWYQGELIGSGAFGKVYMGLNLATWELMAVKQVIIPLNRRRTKVKDPVQELKMEKEESFDSCGSGRRRSKLGGPINFNAIVAIESEMKLLKKLNHPLIIKFLGISKFLILNGLASHIIFSLNIGYESSIYNINIFLEYCDGGSIASCLNRTGPFPSVLTLSLTMQIAMGLEYLHSPEINIIHRDIKAANSMLNGDFLLAIFLKTFFCSFTYDARDYKDFRLWCFKTTQNKLFSKAISNVNKGNNQLDGARGD
jgi:mitogen-activated protein kinase kinase kinase ANP1